MTPKQLRNLIQEVYGYGGQTRLATDIGRGKVNVNRWCSGVTPISRTDATLLWLILMLHRKRINWRKWISDGKLKL